MKLRVGIPYAKRSGISLETKNGILSLKKCKDFEVETVYVQGSNLIRSRNALINKEISDLIHQKPQGFDYILCLDSDIGFSSAHVLQLLAHKKPIISGLYPHKTKSGCGVAGFLNEFGGIDRHIDFNHSYGADKIDWVGAGFLLLERDILERLEYPWFRSELVRFTDEDGNVHQQQTAEDIGFCLNARRQGIDIWLDCDCKLQHV